MKWEQVQRRQRIQKNLRLGVPIGACIHKDQHIETLKYYCICNSVSGPMDQLIKGSKSHCPLARGLIEGRTKPCMDWPNTRIGSVWVGVEPLIRGFQLPGEYHFANPQEVYCILSLLHIFLLRLLLFCFFWDLYARQVLSQLQVCSLIGRMRFLEDFDFIVQEQAFEVDLPPRRRSCVKAKNSL